MSDKKDVIEKDDELNRRIVALPSDKVFTKSRVVFGFLILAALVLFAIWEIRHIALDTNDEVSGQNEALIEANNALLRENAKLDREVADLKDVNGQAVSWIVRLTEEIQRLGGTPPQIVIRPTTTTTLATEEPG